LLILFEWGAKETSLPRGHKGNILAPNMVCICGQFFFPILLEKYHLAYLVENQKTLLTKVE